MGGKQRNCRHDGSEGCEEVNRFGMKMLNEN